LNSRLFTFVGGTQGAWSVTSTTAIAGETLPDVEFVDIIAGSVAEPQDGQRWSLRGITSNERYVRREERDSLVSKQVPWGRATSTHAAIIPIRKSAEWWALAQDERRAVLEEKSQHIAEGLKYLPAIARRLHHCRDLSETEPFDFITLFDFAESDVASFDEILGILRATEEWRYVEREVDIRLVREPMAAS